MANYALVKIINSVETVDNIIVASPEVAATYLIANGGDYDYALDASLYDPAPEMGYLYDPEEDSFSAPSSPEDYAAELRVEVAHLHDVLMTCLDLASNISALQVENAVSGGIADIESGFTATEGDLMSAVEDFINNGG